MNPNYEFVKERDFTAVTLQQLIPPGMQEVIGKSLALAWIGSGLSRVAASVGDTAVHQTGLAASGCFTPLAYCSLMPKSYLPILVTYKGRNDDIFSVARAIEQERLPEVVILSGTSDTPVRSHLERSGVRTHVFALPRHVRERRFVSLLAMLSLSALARRLVDCTSSQESSTRLDETKLTLAWDAACAVSDSASSILLPHVSENNHHWIVLAAGSQAAELLAWDGLLCESGLTVPRLYDIKDFAHGRFLPAFRKGRHLFIVLADNATAHIAKLTSTRLRRYFPVVDIGPFGHLVDSTWAHFVVASLVTSRLIRHLGFDFASPPKPSAARYWTSWGRIPVRKHVRKC